MIGSVDVALVSAFVERWQPDTNTSYMPFGEMSILLHDVYYILRIPVDGMACTYLASHDGCVADMSLLLGMMSESLKKSGILKNSYVTTEVLRRKIREQGVRDLEIQGFLMWLLTSTLFVDKTEDRIHTSVNLLLKDVHKVSTYAWGAGALANLYRELGIASRIDCKEIPWCLTLLQAWIYEYFPTLCPTRCVSRVVGDDQPWCMMWDMYGGGSRSYHYSLPFYWRVLDYLTVDQVIWQPYGDGLGQAVPRSLYCGLIRWIDVIEPYHPDRCLRQFGFRQGIPMLTLPPIFAYRPRDPAKYELVIHAPMADHLWHNLTGNSMQLARISKPVILSHDIVKGYMSWYLWKSHPAVIHPLNGLPQHGTPAKTVASQICNELGPMLDFPDDQKLEGMDQFWERIDRSRPLVDRFKALGPFRSTS